MKKWMATNTCVAKHPAHGGPMHARANDVIFCDARPHELFKEVRLSGNEARDLAKGLIKPDVLYNGDNYKEI
jgi:hypothetical protein